MSKRKKAFTLTELLVVVVIIGVLSAVVLPKFSKMLETRKTGEAEELMAAVRNEQEARCALDKSYIGQGGDKSKLASFPSSDGNNFTYTLTNVGIEASRNGENYVLKIPSYADGRICCEGSGCSELNKDYPSCSDLTNKTKTPDYVAANVNCAAEEIESHNPEGCTNENEHVAQTTTTTDAEGCEVSTTWSFTGYPACQWNKTETKNCPTVAQPCKRVYCPVWDGWVYHPDDWYNDKTWTNNNTECCEKMEPCPEKCPAGQEKVNNYRYDESTVCCATPCPETCEGEKIRDTRVSYQDYGNFGACCKNSCEEFCNNTYGRPCRNDSIASTESNRYTNWMTANEKYYDTDPSVCYECSRYTSRSYPDYKDGQGNVLVKGWDEATCSNATGCPSGYITSSNKTCLKVRYVNGTLGFPMTGHIMTCGPEVTNSGPWSVRYYAYEGGYKSVEGGGTVTVKGYTKELSAAHLCSHYGGAEQMCQSCGKGCTCIVSGSGPSAKPTIISNYSQCGGLSLGSNNHQCCLGEVNTAQFAICE